MITTKDSKPVIQSECKFCIEGRVQVETTPIIFCEMCEKGYTYTKIPAEYIEEVERLLKVEPKDYADTIGCVSYIQAQKRLSEIEQLILNP